MKGLWLQRWMPGLLMALLVAGFLYLVSMRDPVSQFGRYHDDALYVSAARSIAEGRGYAIASLPGTPAQTKYPPLYPHMLSLIWTYQPTFPENLALITWTGSLFAVWFLVMSLLCLRQWQGVPWPVALLCVALCAWSGMFVVTAGAVLSDMPFLAFSITAFYLADLEGEQKAARIGAAVFAGLALLTRSVGVAVAAGIAAAFLYQQSYRKALRFAVGVLPFMAFAVALKLVSAAPVPGGITPGFRQTWLYYTSYAGFWRLSISDLDALLALLQANLVHLLSTPAALCLGPPPPGSLALVLWVTLTVGISIGLVRQAREDCWRPVHFALAFHLPFVMLWNFEITDRLLLLFLPFFYLGLWKEAQHAASGFARSLRPGHSIPVRAISACFLALMAFFTLFVTQRAVRGHWSAFGYAAHRYEQEYAEIFDWVRRHTSPGERFVAIDDVLLYLYTGRQAMWPLAVTTDPRFRPDRERLEEQLALLPDVAKSIGASYLILTSHDFEFAPPVRERWMQWAAALPELARNSQGTVQVLDLRDATGGKTGAGGPP